MTPSSAPPPDEIAVPVWVKLGKMLVRRDALDPDHPEYTANYIRNVLGLNPAEYGYREERTCECCGQVIRWSKP